MNETLVELFRATGLGGITWSMAAMWAMAAALLYVGIVRRFHAILLVPLAFGALLANLPTRGGPEGDLIGFVAERLRLDLFLPLILLGVGLLTDFGPLLAAPRSFVIGAVAQIGLFATFALAATVGGFTPRESAAVGLVSGMDGPTALFVAVKLAPQLLAGVAFGVYAGQCLLPTIQPWLMRRLTTDVERRVRMKPLRTVSRLEKLAFALVMMIVGILLTPGGAPLIAMLMLGNFLRECGVGDRLLKSAYHEIVNVLAVLLGIGVGLTLTADRFLRPSTPGICLLGLLALVLSTVAGVFAAKLLNRTNPGNPFNPLIGGEGVSAMPAAACVAQRECQKADPANVILLHASGASVAGLLGTILAAGYFATTLP